MGHMKPVWGGLVSESLRLEKPTQLTQPTTTPQCHIPMALRYLCSPVQRDPVLRRDAEATTVALKWWFHLPPKPPLTLLLESLPPTSLSTRWSITTLCHSMLGRLCYAIRYSPHSAEVLQSLHFADGLPKDSKNQSQSSLHWPSVSGCST